MTSRVVPRWWEISSWVMRQMGLLRTGRGKIYVLDRPALEGMANL